MDKAANKQHVKRRRKTADKRAHEKHTESAERNFANREPLHKNTGERHDQADDEHIAHNEPLRDGRINPESGAELRNRDIQGRFAEHSGERAQKQTHHREIRMRNLHARFIKTMRHKFATNSFQ